MTRELRELLVDVALVVVLGGGALAVMWLATGCADPPAGPPPDAGAEEVCDEVCANSIDPYCWARCWYCVSDGGPPSTCDLEGP